MGIEDLLAPLGLQLPPAQTPVASYIPVRMIGELAYVSAQIPMVDGKILHPGPWVTGSPWSRGRRRPANAPSRRCLR